MKKILLVLMFLTNLAYADRNLRFGDGLTYTTTLATTTLSVNSTILRDTTNFAGDVTGTFLTTVVGNDSHNHTATTIPTLYTIGATTETIAANLATEILNRQNGDYDLGQSTQSLYDTKMSTGVSRILAGTNITISPTDGKGIVTINSSGGGGGDNLGNHIATTTINANNFDIVNISTITGNSASGGNLNLFSTSHATKGKILFGTSAYDEVNNRLGIGTTAPTQALDVNGNGVFGTGTRTGGTELEVTGTNPQFLFKRAALANSVRMFFMTGATYNWNFGMVVGTTNFGIRDEANSLNRFSASVGSVAGGVFVDGTTGNVGIGTTSPASRIHGVTTLSAATGNEIAYQLNYTTNKLTSGNDTGLLINQTDTASPGTSFLADFQVGGVSKFSVSNTGNTSTYTILFSTTQTNYTYGVSTPTVEGIQFYDTINKVVRVSTGTSNACDWK